MAEATRKFENLKNDLKQSNNTLLTSQQKDRKKSKIVKPDYDDEKEDDDEELFIKDEKKANEAEEKKEPIIKLKNIRKKNNDQDDLGKTFAQRLLDKNRERQLKQKQYKKEHDLKLAFSEFYLSLILLQNYQSLNVTGFRKILKKHDKIFKTGRGMEWHKANVETAPFNLTKKVDTLINDVENLFTQHLEKGDRQRAMKRLRVPPFEEKVSFFLKKSYIQ